MPLSVSTADKIVCKDYSRYGSLIGAEIYFVNQNKKFCYSLLY